MLKTLDYSVTFPTGRTLANKLSFETGFGAIVGPNESGKSFIIEMIRYALFGTNALRGVVADYNNLELELNFQVKGQDYCVRRTTRSATLEQDGATITVGAKPVNEKIVSIFGYGLAVFDVNNVANQDDIQKLGNMRPAERRRLVDSVIGLGVIEDMATSCGRQSLSLDHRSKDLLSVLNEPLAPSKPLGYLSVAYLSPRIKELEEVQKEYHKREGWLKVKREEPKRPSNEGVVPGPDSLRELKDQGDKIKRDKMQLEVKIASIPKSLGFSNAELDELETQVNAFEVQQRWITWQQAAGTPALTQDDIEFQLQGHKKLKLLKHMVECPNCHHRWVDEDFDFEGTPDPTISIKDIQQFQKDLDRFNALKDQEPPRPEKEVEAPKYGRQWIEMARKANDLADERTSLERQLVGYEKRVANMPDYDKMLAKSIWYENQMQAYVKDSQAYMSWLVEYKEQEALQVRDKERLESFASLNALYNEARTYELLLVQYELLKSQYDTNVEQANGYSREAVEWKKAKDALVELRARIKQHLLPSLNKVSSVFLSQMTGGARSQIVVDDDFEITVDGQRLNTLSGSGKAIVNLSIRLGLGQVLTNNVFPVFIADEIDASMDIDRAQYTADTLYTLKNKLSQILLVTHKSPEADYYIDLGKTK